MPLLLLVPVLRLWRMSFRVPMVYWGDAIFSLMLVKNVVEHGSYLTNSNLGAPFGQQLYDFPQGGDNLNILVLWVIGLFTNNAAVAMNLFYLVTYPLVALSALLVLRRFGHVAGRGVPLRGPVHDAPVPLLARREPPVPLRLLGGPPWRVPGPRHARRRRPLRRRAGGRRANPLALPNHARDCRDLRRRRIDGALLRAFSGC